MNLSNKKFELVENSDGHASAKTIMKFGEQTNPFIGTYTGPNNVYGQVIVRTSKDGLTEIVYQSLTTDDVLVTGKAKVTLSENDNGKLIMQLNWQWLTG